MPDRFEFEGVGVPLGASRDFAVPISQSSAGGTVTLPVRVLRGEREGPCVFVTGAVHGDELNGVGVVRGLLRADELALERGSLILVPVVNVLGFERRSRYLPDRRDLNRSFPGLRSGSGASRLANRIFTTIVDRSDFGIDLHTGAAHRTNFPNVRGDLRNPGVRRLALAFGTEVIVNSRGPTGSLRQAATKAGCPTIVLEGGEVGKAEPGVVAVGIRGIHNVLVELGMTTGEIERPAFQVRVNETRWMRSDYGGLLEYHIAPGEAIEKGQQVATCTDLLGREVGQVLSKDSGIVIGLTTSPVVTPGDPVCHIAIPAGGIEDIAATIEDDNTTLLDEVREQLASSVTIAETSDAEED